MRILWTVMMATIVAAVLAAGCCCCKSQMGMGKHHKAVTNVVFVCPDCHMMALKDGKCPMCGKEMKQMHLLGTKDGEALVCGCGADCKCDASGIKDGKCACGKEVMKVSAKGMYVCPSGCPSISAMPGKCPCRMEMKKVE
jgi:hypothetical protein